MNLHRLLCSLLLLVVVVVAVDGVKQQQQQVAQQPLAHSAVVPQPALKQQQEQQPPPPPTSLDTTTTVDRPTLVQEALKNNQPLYYFGLGSNMLRSKLENRSRDGKINVLNMGAAVVKGHRLAFNMRGFPPLEPGMGSLEPCRSSSTKSKALVQYEQDECHGALVKLNPEDYERVMASEGVPSTSSRVGYEEVVVTAIPYDSPHTPVQAIALRSRKRLSKDPCPSLRYMTILRQGAAELGLTPAYQDFLNNHPVQQTPDWLRRVARYNLICTMTLSFKLKKLRFLSQLQRRLLFLVYVPSNAHFVFTTLSNVMTYLLLLPGAMVGFIAVQFIKATGTEMPPFVTRMMSMLDPPSSEESTTAST